MSLKYSPTTGSGMVAGKSGSQPNLTTGNMLSEDSDSSKISLRKRKHTDDTSQVRKDLGDIRTQLFQVMEAITSLSNNQKEFITKVSDDVSAIREEVHDIKVMTNNLTIEQAALKSNIANLSTRTSCTERKIETLQSDLINLQTCAPSTSLTTLAIEGLMSEIRERRERCKNVIITGVTEALSENNEARKNMDKKQVQNIIEIISNECPEIEHIARLGKYSSNKIRPLKVCFKSKEVAVSVLKSRNKLGSDTIKIFADQTPKQQNHFKYLQEELKRRTSEGEKDLIIKYIRGTPRITKLPPKN